MTVELSHLAGILEVSGSLTFSETEKSWLSGVLDTNGAIIMRHYANGYEFPQVRICGPVSLLQEFAKRFGGAITSHPSRPNAMWNKQCAPAQDVLRILRPYMRLRLAEVDKCLAWKNKKPSQARRRAPDVARAVELRRRIGGNSLGDELRRVAG